MTLAITGGTGFVGRRLLALTAERGIAVRALTRRPQEPSNGVAWVEGALDGQASLAELVRGADAVIHIAGLLTGTAQALEAVNVDGTQAVVDAANAAGIRRFVHISSLAAREPQLSSYGGSKAGSEAVVTASALDWTIIRPPAVYGPGDRETLEVFRMARRGLVALPPGGRFSIIHVDDLCRLILDTIPAPETHGRLYEPDDGQPQGWAHGDFARLLGEAFGRRAIALPTPRLAMSVASRVEKLLRGDGAKLTADRVRYLSHPDWVASPAARPPASLWTPRIATPQGLADTARWYLDQGWLR